MLTITDLKVGYAGRTAVDGVSLRVSPGEVYGLLGPNGAGKTSTIGACIGLVRTTGGVIDLNGAGPPSLRAARRHVGWCPQDIALYNDLSARENLVFFAKAHGLDGRSAKARAGALLDRVGLADRAGDRPESFSGGMKRRLNIAAAITHEPPIVLLDEPTVGIDPQSRHSIFEIVEELRESGVAILYTTHYMEEAARLCDRVGIIDRGRLLAEGTVGELIDAHGSEGAAIVVTAEGTTRVISDDPATTLVEQIRSATGRVLSASIDASTLEDVFLDMTGRSLRD